MVEQLRRFSASNFERLSQLIRGRIAEGKLEDDASNISTLRGLGAGAWHFNGAVSLAVLEQCVGRSEGFQFLMDMGI
jgi:hypothetical protein